MSSFFFGGFELTYELHKNTNEFNTFPFGEGWDGAPKNSNSRKCG